MMFGAALQRQCRARGDAPFMLHEDQTVTWAQLLGVVTRTATLLHQRGIRPGERVLLACGNSPVFCYLWFALRWVGATCVPLHTEATSSHVRQVVADAGIRFAVGDEHSMQRLRETGVWPDEHTAVSFGNAPDLEDSVFRLPEHPLYQAEPSEASSLLYTSGTTGQPKGVVLSDEAFLAGGRELANAIGILPDDRILVALPLFHTNPQVYAVMTAISTGCSLALLDRFNPAAFLHQAEHYGATGFTYVGTMLSLLTRRMPETTPPHRLRFCTGGGAPEAVWSVIEDRLGIDVYELYGMTETGGWVTANRAGQRRRGTCGTARPDVECAILDAADNVQPPGTPGQICVRPRKPSVLFDGYHGKPELTLQRFQNLWFHTGDHGFLDADGYLHFLGRADDMIRRGGENIRPADVEAVLGDHPAIDEVAVVGIPDDVVGEEVKAVIVPREDFDIHEITRFLDGKLPRFAWPRFVSVRDHLPKTPTQKVQTAMLRACDPSDIDLRATRPVETAR